MEVSFSHSFYTRKIRGEGAAIGEKEMRGDQGMRMDLNGSESAG